MYNLSSNGTCHKQFNLLWKFSRSRLSRRTDDAEVASVRPPMNLLL